MTLTSAIDAYLTLKRSLGAGLKAQETILRAFGRALGEIPLDAISAEACATFCRSTGAPTRFWENKHQTLRGFFNYLVSRGYLIASPLQEPGPRAAHAFQPYIYSHEELQRLLQATVTLTSARFPLQPLTYRTLLLILYGAGLRASEGLRLRCCDVDLCERLLSIWDTKFFRRFLKKNFLIQDVGAGLIKMSYLGNAGWRSNRSSTACIATLPSAMPFW
jgi:integrase/recombinase XerD